MKCAVQTEAFSPTHVSLASPVMSGCITGIALPATGSVGAI